MLLDVAKQSKGALSRCKVCGRQYTWEPKNKDDVWYDVIKDKHRTKEEPEHCGSTVCSDFWDYYTKHKDKVMNNFEYAKYAYLKKRGVM